MPSTDRKLELTAKASMAQPVSQTAVCSNGLTHHFLLLDSLNLSSEFHSLLSRPFKHRLKYTLVTHIHLFSIHLVMLSHVQTTNRAGSDFHNFFNTHTYIYNTHIYTYIYTHIHRSIICTSWIERGIHHEKS